MTIVEPIELFCKAVHMLFLYMHCNRVNTLFFKPDWNMWLFLCVSCLCGWDGKLLSVKIWEVVVTSAPLQPSVIWCKCETQQPVLTFSALLLSPLSLPSLPLSPGGAMKATCHHLQHSNNLSWPCLNVSFPVYLSPGISSHLLLCFSSLPLALLLVFPITHTHKFKAK